MKQNTWAALTPVYVYGLLLFLLGSIPMAPAFSEKFGDKYQHFIAFGIFEILLYRAIRFAQPKASRARGHILAIIATSLLGGGLELWQALIPWRSCDVLDWLADTVGAVAAATVALALVPIAKMIQRRGSGRGR